MSAFCRLPGKENQKGLLRKGSNAIPPVFQETVCSANAAGRRAEVGARVGLYLLRTVVQVCQDIKSLKHGTHGIDDDEGPVSLQDAITQPAQVAVRGGIMVQGAECGRGSPGTSCASLRLSHHSQYSHLTSVVRKGRNWMLSTLRVLCMCLRSELEGDPKGIVKNGSSVLVIHPERQADLLPQADGSASP